MGKTSPFLLLTLNGKQYRDSLSHSVPYVKIQGKTYVLVKDPAVKPNGVKKIDVTVGRTFDGFALVNSEQLHDGDTVVLAQ